MLITYNQEFEQKQINELSKTWVEEFLVSSKRNRYLDNWLTVNELTTLKIKRIIQSDNFILTFEHINSLNEIKEIKINALINNKLIDIKPIYHDNKSIFINTYNSDLDTKNKFEFKDINNINFEIYYRVNGYWYQVQRFTYWIKNNPRSKNIIVNKKTNIKLLSQIEINSKPDRINPHLISHNVNTEYLNLEFKSTFLELGKHNKKIYDLNIYKIKNDNIENLLNSDIYDFELSPISLFNNAKLKYNIKQKFEDFGKSQIIIDSYSYYDKYSDSIKIDEPSSQAKIGLLIPLNFKGDFGHTLNFNIGKNLKNFKLTYPQYIEKPFFSIDGGLIKMKVKNIKGWLTQENYHKIKYENITEIIKNAENLETIEKIGIK
ncbi:hypothetical protein DMC14_001680 [Metamycoplasma phocicerebrale]|uniref:Uncharacterized protein n=1 Tax=Metamycoplasma phocicerebrale TaxID=142649 RepID=A0A3Q9VA81_9BACT|nr:hypothetical protein [Metamycoplasma phocicerebrale]AZZ65494.1 hypothetical protein DMC14_001680 [Metamycoplasma phocicerebrale]